MGTSTHAYGEPSYWDLRYRKDSAPFDWYQKYSTLAPLLDLYLRRHHRVLLVGCGSSTLGENMINNGYESIVNIDISSVVIEKMEQKYKAHPGLKFYQLDAREMNIFESGSFDAVIDKGTLDSLMCGPQAHQNATKMLEEIGRILKDKGIYILVTYGDPSYRLHLLRNSYLWDVNLHVIDRLEKAPGLSTWEVTKKIPPNADGSFETAVLGPKPEVHYIYVCSKDEKKRQQRAATALNDMNETEMKL